MKKIKLFMFMVSITLAIGNAPPANAVEQESSGVEIIPKATILLYNEK